MDEAKARGSRTPNDQERARRAGEPDFTHSHFYR
jgi:hypothetical protein